MGKQGVVAATEVLPSYELFRDLDPRSVGLILSQAKFSRVAPRSALVRQGDAPGHLLLLVEGQVKVSRVADDGREVTVHLMQSGDLIGCDAVFRDLPHLATATSIGNCGTYSWPREQALSLMEAYPRLALNALCLVSGLLADLFRRDAEMNNGPVRRRLAVQLLKFVPPGEANGDPLQEVRMTRQELGQLCGTTLFTVSRVLCNWERAGIVTLGRGRVRLVDRARLSRIAGGDMPR
ncbi:Crp/Fnr family transcriptional regulator [Methylobacterium sp.]|uniref:Crp/Fnr family transcriptional regulator n=1 Tax=Methylobacterium sp. TaxID=409 RepID=UPI003B02AB79